MDNNIVIKRANELIKGRGDGRISVNDINEIFSLDYSNIENVNNLFHVYNNYNLTESAKSQFSKNIHKWSNLYCLIKKNIE